MKTVLERFEQLNDEAERNAQMDSGWSMHKCIDIAEAKARILNELVPQLRRIANVAACIELYTAGPSQHWNKGHIRAAAKQLTEMLDAAGIPAQEIEDGCAF